MPDLTVSPSQAEPDAFDASVLLIKELIDTRNFRKERLADPIVASAITEIGRGIVNESTPENRLEAVSILGKAGEISKPIALVVQAHLKTGLRSPCPPVGDWGNADDRYYLAKGISVSESSWVATYAAQELARAEIAEKAPREVWAQLAINRADTLTQALQTIAEALAKQLAALNNPVDVAYRKLVRICDALSSTLLTADVPAGPGFGRALSDLVMQAGGKTGGESLRLREDAAVTALDLIVQILRFRFDILFDPEIYKAVGRVRSWWRPGRPPDTVEGTADRIAQLAFNGLHILARQGVQDNELRQVLVSALGADRIARIGKHLSSNDPSLTAHLSHWLATGRALEDVQSNDSVGELNQRDADGILGRLILTLHTKEGDASTMRIIADEIEALEPHHAITLRSSADRLDLLNQWVNALAATRRLEVFGQRGETAEYDPALHESTLPVTRLAPVRISSPGVLRAPSGRPPLLIFKAIVEKI